MNMKEEKRMNKKYYNCYSPKMMIYLSENEVLPIDLFFHKETGKRVWVYKLDGKLSNHLKEWSRKNK